VKERKNKKKISPRPRDRWGLNLGVGVSSGGGDKKGEKRRQGNMFEFGEKEGGTWKWNDP